MQRYSYDPIVNAWIISKDGEYVRYFDALPLENRVKELEAAQQRDLVTLTGNQAEAILEAFGGEGTTVTIRHLEASKDEEDGSDMPAGLYLYYTEYPEEGVTFLGEEDQDYRPPYLSAPKPPAEWMAEAAREIVHFLCANESSFKSVSAWTGAKCEQQIKATIAKHAPKVPEGEA